MLKVGELFCYIVEISIFLRICVFSEREDCTHFEFKNKKLASDHTPEFIRAHYSHSGDSVVVKYIDKIGSIEKD